MEWDHHDLTILVVQSGSRGHSTSPLKVLFCMALITGVALKASTRRHPVSTDYAVSVSLGYRGTRDLSMALWLLREGLILRSPLSQAQSGLCLRLRLEPSPHSSKTLPTEPMKRW